MSRFALTDAISELLDTPVVERGVNVMLHCPLDIHEDRRPSFSIHLDEGMWTCFSCQEKGNLNQLYRRLGVEIGYDVKFAQAKKMAEAPIIQSHNFASVANACVRNLRQSVAGQRAVRGFIESRGISRDAVAHYSIGWDEQRGAISFPYDDQTGRVTGIKYRYINGFKASETGSQYGLFGVNDVAGKQSVIICEGESDTLAVWSAYGKRYGVGGTSGASVSDTQWSRFGVSLLFAERIYLLYDSDEAGDRCAETAMRVLGDDKCVRLRPTRGKDASEHLMNGGNLEEIGLRLGVMA